MIDLFLMFGLGVLTGAIGALLVASLYYSSGQGDAE
jgi:hypothetical protein